MVWLKKKKCTSFCEIQWSTRQLHRDGWVLTRCLSVMGSLKYWQRALLTLLKTTDRKNHSFEKRAAFEKDTCLLTEPCGLIWWPASTRRPFCLCSLWVDGAAGNPILAHLYLFFALRPSKVSSPKLISVLFLCVLSRLFVVEFSQILKK